MYAYSYEVYLGSALHAVRDVVSDGGGEEVGVLVDDGHLLAQMINLHGRQVDAVNENLPDTVNRNTESR